MSNSFTLLITILLITIFSYLSIKTLEIKSFKSKNIQYQYLYIQAKNHNKFLKEYLQKIDLKDIKKIEIQDNLFKISAKIKKDKDKISVENYIKAKNFDIALYDSYYK